MDSCCQRNYLQSLSVYVPYPQSGRGDAGVLPDGLRVTLLDVSRDNRCPWG